MSAVMKNAMIPDRPFIIYAYRLTSDSGNAPCVVVNIGGMANISILGSDGKTIGFDTGPGNVLLDAWIAKNKNRLYDENGEWAASGKPDGELLALMLQEPFFSLSPPKSTGRDLFNEEWLEAKLSSALEFAILMPEKQL